MLIVMLACYYNALTGAMTVLTMTLKGQKIGNTAIPGYFYLYPQIVGIILPFISL